MSAVCLRLEREPANTNEVMEALPNRGKFNLFPVCSPPHFASPKVCRQKLTSPPKPMLKKASKSMPLPERFFGF